MLLEACGKLSALKHLSDPQYSRCFYFNENIHKPNSVPNHSWTPIWGLPRKLMRTSAICSGEISLTARSCQTFFIMMFRTYKKNLILFGVSPTSSQQRLRSDVIKGDISDLLGKAGFPGYMSCFHTCTSCSPYFILAMMAAGHGIHCRVSMHPLLAVEFYAGYVRWCQFTPAMGCHTQFAGIPANGILATLPHAPTCVWYRCALFGLFLMWQFVTNMSCN